MSAIANSSEPIEEEWPTALLRYLEASSFLLIIWYWNKWLLNSTNAIKSKVGVEAAILISNPLIIVAIVLIDFLLVPSGLGTAIPWWLLAVRMTIAALIFNVILRIFKSQRERSALKLQNLSLQAENLKFQVETLKQQINPHFLFNSLNTLLDLIEEDKEAATQYVRNFSKLYRVVLQSAKHDFILLEEELKFLNDYWSLLKVRFKDAIDLDVQIDDSKMQSLIPPLSLQFLIENAVKHNEATKATPLLIEIADNNGSLTVKNKVNLKSYRVASEKLGLKNLQQRFTLLYQPIQYGNGHGYFTVKIPLKTNA
ncbi:MAG: histidine kinase [Bacteroidota bacterium]